MNVNLESLDITQKYPLYMKRWLSPDDLASKYGFSKSTQSKMRMQSNPSNLPFSKVGKFVRYDRIAIDKWLEEYQIRG